MIILLCVRVRMIKNRLKWLKTVHSFSCTCVTISGGNELHSLIVRGRTKVFDNLSSKICYLECILLCVSCSSRRQGTLYVFITKSLTYHMSSDLEEFILMGIKKYIFMSLIPLTLLVFERILPNIILL